MQISSSISSAIYARIAEIALKMIPPMLPMLLPTTITVSRKTKIDLNVWCAADAMRIIKYMLIMNQKYTYQAFYWRRNDNALHGSVI